MERELGTTSSKLDKYDHARIYFLSVAWLNFCELKKLVWASITKYHILGSTNNRHLFPHCSGGCKSQFKMPWGWVPSKSSFLGWQTMLSHCVLSYMAFSLHL